MIKFYLIFILIFCSSFLTRAQLFKSPLFPYWIIHEDEVNGQSPNKYHFNFKEMIVKTGKKSMRYIYNYDKEGRMISYLEEKTKDKLKNDNNKKNRGFLITYSIADKKLKQKVFYFKNSKATRKDSFNYNRFDEITSYLKFDKNNQLISQDIYTYDSSLIKEHQKFTFKNGLKKMNCKEVYEYETDLQLKKISYFNKKNKVYKRTVFDCNPIGVNHKVSKDSSYKCVKYDKDSLGNKLQITIENERNYSVKIVKYFNNENKLIAYKRFDVKHDRPDYFTFYNPETGSVIKQVIFKKGKEFSRSETTFNDEKYITESKWYMKNKLSYLVKYQYNKDGLLVKLEGYNKKNKIVRTNTYVYGLN